MWDAEYVKFSWFSREFAKQDTEQIFLDLVGNRAETFQRNNTVNQSQSYLTKATGDQYGFSHIVQIDPFRLELIVCRKPDGKSGPFELLFDLNPILDRIGEKISNHVFPNVENINRLALSASLCKIFNDSENANKTFVELCSLNICSKHSSDLQFRINRSKKYKNYYYNRVITYDVKDYLEIITNKTSEETINERKGFSAFKILLDFNSILEIPDIGNSQGEFWKEFMNEAKKFKSNPSISNLEQ